MTAGRVRTKPAVQPPASQPEEVTPKGGFASAIAFLTTNRASALGVLVAVALTALALADVWILKEYGGGSLSQAVVAESEAWIAAAASVGLWATARHVSRLTAAIAELRLNYSPAPVALAPVPSDSNPNEPDELGGPRGAQPEGNPDTPSDPS